MEYIRKKLSSNNITERILFTAILFFIVFFGVTIISYFLLPGGLLKNKNPLQGWETSDNSFVLTLQIFFYNMLSVILIVLASLFGKKGEGETEYLSVGYTAFFTLICINAVTLGTWSFSVEHDAVPLLDRITRTFDLVHRAGLWEMMGQLLITCAVAHIATVLTSGKNTITKKINDIRLTKTEKTVLITGFVLMLTGAVVESIGINAL
ncbi:MAG: hypothetical protein WAX07_09350 [Candidatus Altiarchaeia archaeon]